MSLLLSFYIPGWLGVQQLYAKKKKLADINAGEEHEGNVSSAANRVMFLWLQTHA